MIGKTPREIELAGADGGMHARLAQSLRDAARYIETHPNLPIPAGAELTYCIPAATDKDGEDEAYRIAAILGTKVTGDEMSETRLPFGPVAYVARYISREHMAAYSEHMQPWYASLSARREGPAAA